MRAMLESEFQAIHVDIIKMGTMIEKAIENTITALTNKDVVLARAIYEGDDVFDQMALEIENKCTYLIARQQPVASDLRRIFSIVKIVTDLERIADHCQDIAKLTLDLSNKNYIKPLIDLPKMAAKVKEMIKMTVDCYIDQDVELAKEICMSDDIVDEYYQLILDDLELLMRERSQDIRQCMDFMMIAKYLERMADHTTNIAEWVIYSVKGERFDGNH